MQEVQHYPGLEVSSFEPLINGAAHPMGMKNAIILDNEKQWHRKGKKEVSWETKQNGGRKVASNCFINDPEHYLAYLVS